MQNIKINIMRPKGFHKNIELIVSKAIKNVNINNGWKNISSCPVCKKKKKIFWLKKKWIDIYQCLNCKAGYSSKVPNNLSDIYDLDDEIDDKIKVHNKRSDYFTKKFLSERIKVIKKLKKKGRLLDFGCGTGEFANLARKSFKTEVFDFSKKLTSFVYKKYKIKYYNHLKQIKKKYDVITIFDVIEHLENPIQILKKLAKLLKRGGIIIIYTPNKDSLSFKFLKEKSNLCTTPFHLVYFTPETFKMLKINKLKIKYLKTFGLDMADIFAFLRDNSNEKVKKDDFLSFQPILDSLSFSNHLRVIFQKK